MLIYAHLLAGLARMIWHRVQTSDLSNIRSINIPWSGLALSHATFTAFIPTEVSPCYIRWSWHPWATAVLEAHPCGQEALSISKFTSSVWRSSLTISTGALPEHCWHPNWHPSIHRIDQYSHCWIWQVMIQCVETFLSFFTLAHGCPRRVPSADVKDMDELQNRMFQ